MDQPDKRESVLR